MTLRSFKLLYGEREREALLTILQGCLHDNNQLETFAVRALTEECWRNSGGFIENESISFSLFLFLLKFIISIIGNELSIDHSANDDS